MFALSIYNQCLHHWYKNQCLHYTWANNVCIIDVQQMFVSFMYNHVCITHVEPMIATLMYIQCLHYPYANNVWIIDVQLMFALFMYKQCLQCLCTTNVCNVHVQPMFALSMYNQCLHHPGLCFGSFHLFVWRVIFMNVIIKLHIYGVFFCFKLLSQTLFSWLKFVSVILAIYIINYINLKKKNSV